MHLNSNDNGSPMIRRVQSGKQRSALFFVPKKGRIRALLAFIGILVFLKVVSGFFDKQSMPPKAKKDSTNTDSGLFFKQNRFSQSFKIAEINAIFNERSPVFCTSLDTVEKGADKLLVHLTIDTVLQRYGELLLKRYHPRYGAVVVLEPSSGRILSLLSYTNDTVPSLGDNLYCRSIFPAASVYKTITAAAAIEKAKFTSSSTIQHVGRNHTLYRFQLERELKHSKEVSLEEAFSLSINPVFARIAMHVLHEGALNEFGQKFGFNTTIPFELSTEQSNFKQGDSAFSIAEVASGFNRTTTISPLFGALLAASIVEDGKMPVPTLIDSITSMANGESVFKNSSKTWRVPILSSTAQELRTLMSRVVTNGTARKSFRHLNQTARFDTYQFGGKTGSVDKDSLGRVDWFVGFVRHPSDRSKRLAIGIVTTHGSNWTVHSSYIAAELFRTYLNNKSVTTTAISKSNDTLRVSVNKGN